jgi:glutamyl-tRNA(Gln) amidotransferase subunit E
MSKPSLDYTKIGLKVGLEIHQQLKVNSKLFCSCSPELFKEEPDITFLRRLRPTQSELGQVDPAAYFEFQKGNKILYEANRTSSCLVEMDEEPPHPINMDAVEVVLTASLMMNMQPVDEVHVMRKTVIDGSNTTGFQRTTIIALDGWIVVGGKTIPMQAVSLEEDSARKTATHEDKTTCYRIDRLGIPLIEVTTAPVIYSPQEAQEVAFAIGRILRDTGKVMRGLGTIRQDLNVSLPNGALIEIKGVQTLDLISTVVEYEAQRQLGLIAIKDELANHNITPNTLKAELVEVTNIFEATKSKVLRKALDKNQTVFAVKLIGFAGLTGRELMPNFRFGSELSDRAKFWGRVGGIFHTDEALANYGITPQEITLLREVVQANPTDAVVFVADTAQNSQDALKAVIARAQEACLGIPQETRTAKDDGTTRYMRPRPGAARMYPETDIPPQPLTPQLVQTIQTHLPESADKKFQRLSKQYSLNEKLTKQLLDSEYLSLFEEIAQTSGVSAATIAAFLTETIKALQRDGIPTAQVTDEQISCIFRAVGCGELAKEAIADVFSWLAKNEDKTVSDAVSALGFKMFTEAELAVIIDRIVVANKVQIEKLGKNAMGMLMGAVMKEVRGKASPDLVSKLLKKAVG